MIHQHQNPIDSEIRSLASELACGELTAEQVENLACSALLGMLCEPGDRMMGALYRILGPKRLVSLLLSGLRSNQLISQELSLQHRYELEETFGDYRNTLEDSRQRWLPRLNRQDFLKLLKIAKDRKYKLISRTDHFWPESIKDLNDSTPIVLYCEGNSSILSKLNDAVAIVGSRSASGYGITVTRELVKELAKNRNVTVSGGALGIDSVCHRASLDFSIPTVAVMAGGLARKYPKQNLELFREIAGFGAVISELPATFAPTRWRFLQRNRIIAALGQKVVVVEAGYRSGSIRTANNALELSRSLFAVPGPIFSITSMGTNQLISDGKATPLLQVTEISGERMRSREHSESELATRAIDAIRELGLADSDAVAKKSGLTKAEMALAIYELSSRDLIERKRLESGQVHYALNYGNRT